MLVLNALILKSSDLLQFNHTHNAAVFSSKYEAFDLQIGYITPSFVGHSFRVRGETWYFFCQFTVVHLDLISNIFLRCFVQVELLE